MSKSKRAIEWVKTALIVLLTVSALLLAWRTGLFSDYLASVTIFGSFAELVRGTSGSTEPSGAAIKEAARPMTIVVTNEDGGRLGVRYDTDERDAVYEMTSSILGEALGSASTPVEINEEEWRLALSGAGVYFEYITPVRLSFLDGWLDAVLPEAVKDVALRRIFIAFGDDRSKLYYQDHENGRFYGADTASAAGKAQGLEIFSTNGALFAYETGISGSTQAPYMLLMPGNEHPDVKSASVGSSEQLLELVLPVFGHRNESTTTYQSDGALVCFGTQFNVRVYADGRVVYRRTDIDGLQSEEEAAISDGEIIEQARAIAADSIGRACGSANAAFEAFESEGDTASVFFAYHIAGGRVCLSEETYAARVSFTSGMVTEAEMNFRNFAFTDEYTRLLPEKQALAAAGGEFILCYSDTGTDILRPDWVKYGG